MGTRNLTAVMINNEYKIAQYGQWDGYPSDSGVRILNFLKEMNADSFKDNLSLLRFPDEDDEKKVAELLESVGSRDGWVDMDQGRKIDEAYPLLSRDVGADILNRVADLKEPVFIRNKISFAGDSLFCEWCYVIDFDKDVLEVYSGFNMDPITKGRFISSDENLEKADGYGPVSLAKEYPLSELPSESQFLEDLKESDE